MPLCRILHLHPLPHQQIKQSRNPPLLGKWMYVWVGNYKHSSYDLSSSHPSGSIISHLCRAFVSIPPTTPILSTWSDFQSSILSNPWPPSDVSSSLHNCDPSQEWSSEGLFPLYLSMSVFLSYLSSQIFNPNSSVGHLCIHPWRKSHDLNTGALQIHVNRCWSPRAAHKSFHLSATNFFSGFPQPASSGREAKSCLDLAVRRTNNFSPV